MSVKSYSQKQLGKNYSISKNFVLGEFACKDGNDIVIIDDELKDDVQKIRDHFEEAIIINSAYRTKTYNTKVGGSPNSQHLNGKALDIVVRNHSPLEVAQFAEALGMRGIGYYPAGQGNFTHIDTRDNKSFWKKQNGKEIAVSTHGAISFANQVKNATGFEDKTINYLCAYVHAAPLFYKLAEAIYKRSARNIVGNSYDKVQKGAGVDDNTMFYLKVYEYGDALLEKLAKAMS